MNDTNETGHQIKAALVAVGAISDPLEWSVLPAGGGLSQRVFLVGHAGQSPSFTARLPLPGRAWSLTRQHTLLWTLAGTCACVPRSLMHIERDDLPGGMMVVQRFVTGNPMALQLVSAGGRATLASCLACLHAQSRERYTIWPDLQPANGSRADLFRARVTAMTHHATFRSGLGSERHGRVQEVFHGLSSVKLPAGDGWDASRFSQLHGDLAYGNMVWNNKSVTLIDWEYARDGDPAEELAYLFAEQPMSEQFVSTFHQSYIATGGDPHATLRAAWYTPLVALDSALWWGDYHLRQGTDPSVAGEVSDFIDLAEASLRNVTGEQS